MDTVGASSSKRARIADRVEAVAKINTGDLAHEVCEQSRGVVAENEQDGPQQQEEGKEEVEEEEGEERGEGEDQQVEQGEGEQEVSVAEQALLTDEPPLPTLNDEVDKLAQVAARDPQGIRGYILERATALALAAGCNCGDELSQWTPQTASEVATCGRLQADFISGLDMEAVYNRQVERENRGDNVGYALARTARSNIQNRAAKAMGAQGGGNQCTRGACMKAAMGMFDGGYMDGIPQSVVWALFHQ